MRAVVSWVGRALGSIITLALAVAIVLGLFGLGFSSSIGDDYIEVEDSDAPQPFTFTITEVADGSVTLASRDGSALVPIGRWGLEFPGGYGQLDELVSGTNGSVTGRFALSDGDPPEQGTVARLDPWFWRGDPAAAGTPFTDVSYSTELGDYPAWLAGPSSDLWLIVVHDKGTDRQEGLRLVAPAADAGVSTMLITYRNDREAPAGPTGRYQWGKSEWRDLEGAVRYALSNGADRVALAGYGMGGSIVLSFLQESELASSAVGVILDSPVIDLDATVSHDLSQAQLGAVFDLPTAINSAARLVAGWRFDIDWGQLDFGDAPIEVPILIFHGSADLVTPLAESQAFAARSPLVDLRVAFDAGFTEGWNVDQGPYDAAVTAFLGGL